MRRKSSRQRGQSIVEFGGVIVFLTLLIAAVIDFGVLMNEWLTVASDARQIARDAAVGARPLVLQEEASDLPIPGISNDNFFAAYCCSPGDALVLSVTFQQCPPIGVCTDIPQASLDSWYGYPAGGCAHGGGGCLVPGRPRPAGVAGCTGSVGQACPGDIVRVTFSAARAHMLTPILQPMCRPSPSACVTLQNTVIMRFDGSGL